MDSLLDSDTHNRKCVGISGLQSPIKLQQQNGEIQQSIATCTATATNMMNDKGDLSQEVALHLHGFTEQITPINWNKLLTRIKNSLMASEVSIEIEFPFFISKKAPISGIAGLMEYKCSFSGNSNDDAISTTVHVPVTTLCPCSKEISEGGAHNQRAEATFTVFMTERIWIEELIEIIEKSASCELYSVLKRPDEKYVTEKAFNNPMFVEDVVRKITLEALEHPRIENFTIGVESFESIHKHSAYAYVDSDDLKI